MPKIKAMTIYGVGVAILGFVQVLIRPVIGDIALCIFVLIYLIVLHFIAIRFGKKNKSR